MCWQGCSWVEINLCRKILLATWVLLMAFPDVKCWSMNFIGFLTEGSIEGEGVAGNLFRFV